MGELSYTFHLGSDKNKKNSVRSFAKNNISGSTSMSNNGIQNIKTLSKCDKHNYRKYDDDQSKIEIVRGTSSPMQDVKELYHKEFDNAVKEYNDKQTRNDRKINDYFKKVSDNAKSDLACEIIIELGDKTYWDTKDDNYKKKMTNVYKKQVEDLELLVPNFKVCSAIIHYDETSPHMHIIGVPIKYNCKSGPRVQVGKSDVFNKVSLTKIQDSMRTLCIESFNKEYNENNKLKKKLKGRNRDINVKDMYNYSEVKQTIEKHQKEIDKIDTNSKELNDKSDKLKDKINNLKPNTFKKNSYTISEEDKKSIESFIESVKDSNKDYLKVKDLSSTLSTINESYQSIQNENKILKENNNALELRVNKLTSKIKELEEKVFNLENINKALNKFKYLYNRLLGYLKNRITKSSDKDKYKELAKDLKTHDILEDENYNNLLNVKKDKEIKR